jgi:hypothetical protein
MAKPPEPELEAGPRRLKLRRVREPAPADRPPPKGGRLPRAQDVRRIPPHISQPPRATFEFLRSLEWLERQDN